MAKKPKQPDEPESGGKPEKDDLAQFRAAAEAATIATRAEDMEAATLAGDARDVMLRKLRAIKVPWAMLSELEQRGAILEIEDVARNLAAARSRWSRRPSSRSSLSTSAPSRSTRRSK